MLEVWVPIHGYSRYQISNQGSVRRVEFVAPNGRYYPPKLLKPSPDNRGYLKITLIGDEGQSTTFKIHRLVAMHFVSNPHRYPVVDHVDGNKLHNEDSNLEWVTQSVNVKRAIDIGLRVYAKKGATAQ